MLVVIIGVAEHQYARTIRASVLAEEKEYVEAARVMGFKAPRMFRHILPNCLSPILVYQQCKLQTLLCQRRLYLSLALACPLISHHSEL